MKKNVIKTTVAAVCVVAAGMGGFKAYNAAAQSEVDMLLAENVEALSYGDAPGFGCKEKTITIIVSRPPCLAYSWEKKYTGYDTDKGKAYYQWEVEEEVYGYSSQTQTITVPIEDPRTDQSSMVTTCGACPSGKVTSPAALTEEKPLGVQEEPYSAQYNKSVDTKDTNPFRDRTSVDTRHEDTNPFRYRTDEPTFIKDVSSSGWIEHYRLDDHVQAYGTSHRYEGEIDYFCLDDDVTIGKNGSVSVRIPGLY